MCERGGKRIERINAFFSLFDRFIAPAGETKQSLRLLRRDVIRGAHHGAGPGINHRFRWRFGVGLTNPRRCQLCQSKSNTFT